MREDNRLSIAGNKVLITEPGMYGGAYGFAEAGKKVVKYNHANPIGRTLMFPRKVKVGAAMNAVTTNLGYTYGPGWQCVTEGAFDYIYTDGEPEEVVAMINAEIKKVTGKPGGIRIIQA